MDINHICFLFKYEEGLRRANDAMRDLMELVNMPDFEQRDGWKRKNSNRNDVVYSKRYSMGKVFTMRVIKNFQLIYENIL